MGFLKGKLEVTKLSQVKVVDGKIVPIEESDFTAAAQANKDMAGKAMESLLFVQEARAR